MLSASYRDDANPDVGVKVAAGEAFRKAVAQASPLQLEPIMIVQVALPEGYLGSVIGDLRQRGLAGFDHGPAGEIRVDNGDAVLGEALGRSTLAAADPAGQAD